MLLFNIANVDQRLAEIRKRPISAPGKACRSTHREETTVKSQTPPLRPVVEHVRFQVTGSRAAMTEIGRIAVDRR